MALLPGDELQNPAAVVDEAHQIVLLKERVTELEKRLDLLDTHVLRLWDICKHDTENK